MFQELVFPYILPDYNIPVGQSVSKSADYTIKDVIDKIAELYESNEIIFDLAMENLADKSFACYEILPIYMLYQIGKVDLANRIINEQLKLAQNKNNTKNIYLLNQISDIINNKNGIFPVMELKDFNDLHYQYFNYINIIATLDMLHENNLIDKDENYYKFISFIENNHKYRIEIVFDHRQNLSYFRIASYNNDLTVSVYINTRIYELSNVEDLIEQDIYRLMNGKDVCIFINLLNNEGIIQYISKITKSIKVYNLEQRFD